MNLILPIIAGASLIGALISFFLVIYFSKRFHEDLMRELPFRASRKRIRKSNRGDVAPSEGQDSTSVSLSWLDMNANGRPHSASNQDCLKYNSDYLMRSQHNSCQNSPVTENAEKESILT